MYTFQPVIHLSRMKPNGRPICLSILKKIKINSFHSDGRPTRLTQISQFRRSSNPFCVFTNWNPSSSDGCPTYPWVTKKKISSFWRLSKLVRRLQKYITRNIDGRPTLFFVLTILKRSNRDGRPSCPKTSFNELKKTGSLWRSSNTFCNFTYKWPKNPSGRPTLSRKKII